MEILLSRAVAQIQSRARDCSASLGSQCLGLVQAGCSLPHCITRDTHQQKPGRLWTACASGEEAVTNASLDSQSPYVSVQSPSMSPFHLKYWICFLPAVPGAFYRQLCLDGPLKRSDSACWLSWLGQRTPDEAAGSGWWEREHQGLLPSHCSCLGTEVPHMWGHGWWLSTSFPWLSVVSSLRSEPGFAVTCSAVGAPLPQWGKGCDPLALSWAGGLGGMGTASTTQVWRHAVR